MLLLRVVLGLVIMTNLAASSYAQNSAKLPTKIDNGFVLFFRPPYSQIAVDIDDKAWQTATVITLSPQAKFFNHKNKPVEPQAIRTGLEVEIKLAPEATWEKLLAASIKIKEDPEKEVKVEGYLDKASSQEAYVDGQPVLLPSGVALKGVNEWKGRTFGAWADIPLGSRLALRGVRQPDGFIYVAQGEAKPNNVTPLEMNLARQVQIGLTRPPAGQSGAGVVLGNESYKVCENLELNQYVTMVGYKVVPRYLKEQIRIGSAWLVFRFYVIANDTPNASSLPDGSVLVTTGLLRLLDNEAQLATILGHEIAHITNEHFRREAESAEKRAVWVGLGAAAAGVALGADVGNIVGSVGFSLLSRKFSRDLEKQADRVGLFYAYDAGYDLREGAKVWRKLMEESYRPDKVSTFLYSDHPTLQTRMRNSTREFFTNYPKADFREALTEAARYRAKTSGGCEWVEPKLSNVAQPAPSMGQPPNLQTKPRRKPKHP